MPIKSTGLQFDPAALKRLRGGNVKLQPAQPGVQQRPTVPAKTNYQLFHEGNEFLPAHVKPGAYPFVEAMREASLVGDWEKLFELWPVNQWARIPLGKFRFNWGPDGRPRYVPFTKQSMQDYFRGPWVTINRKDGVCPEDFINKYAHDYYVDGFRNVKKHPNTHPHYIYRMYPPSLICKEKKGSVWVRIRKPVVAAVAIVSAVYLGPAALAKIKAVTAKAVGAATSGAGAASGAATTGATGGGLFGTIKAGSAGLINAVNKGRTIKAIAEGKLPPPPISIEGDSFREWAFIQAKEELIKQGQKVGAQEEAAIRAEIAQLQREMIAATPPAARHIPAQPMQTLAPQIQRIQVREEQRADKSDDLLKTALIVGVPLALLAMGG